MRITLQKTVNYHEGLKAWNLVNYPEALKYFWKSYEADTSFILPCLGMANISHFRRDDELAREYMKMVERSTFNLTKPDAIRAEALNHILKIQNDEAIEDYVKLTDYMPGNKESYFELAEAYFRNGNIERAAENYMKALRIDPDFTLAHNHLAYCYSAWGKHDSAVIHVRRYLQLDSSANAWDSYGDILFTMGDLKAAAMAKKSGIKIGEGIDYLYESLAYINVQQGHIREAFDNIDKYLSYHTEPVYVTQGLADKAFIYYVINDYTKALNTCLEALKIMDSRDLLTRNHILHWILTRIYLEENDITSFNRELREMEDIISKNHVTRSNYNTIYKFYLDAKIHKLFIEKRISEAQSLIEEFDEDIYAKVKDWTYPFDLALFNTEFGKLYLRAGDPESARERFEKALQYNPRYLFAHMGMAVYYQWTKDEVSRQKEFDQFLNTLGDADPEIKAQFLREYAVMSSR